MAISPLPPAPARTDAPAVFVPKADAMIAALQPFADQANALAADVNDKHLETIDYSTSAANSAASALTSKNEAAASAASAVLAPGSNGTSTTSLVVGSGTIVLTTQTGKSFVIGAWVNITRTSDVSRSMLGQISSYNSGTGVLTVSVQAANVQGAGNGPYSDWTISQSSMPGNVITAVNLSNIGPSIRPSLLCDFANSKTIDSRFIYAMTSPLSYYDQTGLLKYSPANQPTFDHDPFTGESKGISMWGGKTNLLIHSESFDQTWIKGQGYVSINSGLAPDGSWSADKFVEDTSNNVHNFLQQVSSQPAGVYTYSMYVKPAGRSQLSIQQTITTTYGLTYDLNTLTTSGSIGGASGNITRLQNGYYRVDLTFTTTVSIALLISCYMMAGGTTTYTGDGASGMFVWGAQLEASSFASPYIPSTQTFASRASSATYYDSTGLLVSAGTNVERLTYNPADLTLPPKQLFELGATNLQSYSEQFDNAAWTKNTVSILANNVTGPGGTAGGVVADRLTASAGNTTHNMYQNFTATAQYYTNSVYAKGGSAQWISLGFNNSAIDGAFFNLNTGTLGQVATGTFASMQKVGDGYWRCSVTKLLTATTWYHEMQIHSADAQNATWNAAGTEYVYIFGAQTEAQLSATDISGTSYIATTTGAASRSADLWSSASAVRTTPSLYMNVDSSWFNPFEGTLYATMVATAAASIVTKAAVALSGGSGNYSLLGQRAGGGTVGEVVASGVSQMLLQDSVTTQTLSSSLSYKFNDGAISLNGSLPTTDTSITLPSAQVLYVGCLGTSNIMEGCIPKVAYYPRRLSNTELTAMTTQ